jgi:hypothetical protein
MVGAGQAALILALTNEVRPACLAQNAVRGRDGAEWAWLVVARLASAPSRRYPRSLKLELLVVGGKRPFPQPDQA